MVWPIDTSKLPVNHCSHSTAFHVLNRKVCATCGKVCGTRRDGKTASQAELASRATTQCKQRWYVITDGRKRSEGLVVAVTASAVQVNGALRSINDFCLSSVSPSVCVCVCARARVCMCVCVGGLQSLNQSMWWTP